MGKIEQKKKNKIILAILAVVVLGILIKPVLFPESKHEFIATNEPETVYRQAVKDGEPVFLEFHLPG